MNALVNPLMPQQMPFPQQQNPLMNLASNPLFALGTQLLSNSQPGPTYRPMFQGVPQAMAMAGQQGMLMQQFERQQEEDDYRRSERARKEAERQRRTQGLQGLNPLDPEDLGRQLMATGDPELAMEGLKILSQQGQQGRKPVMVMGPNGQPTYVPESESYGQPAVVPGMLPKTPDQMAQARELAALRGGQAGMPSDIREWQVFQQMTPEQQQQYLTMKRANPYLNLGGEMVQPNPIQPGQAMGSFEKSLPPQDLPETRAEQAAAVEAGKETGIAEAALAEREAAIPRLEQVVSELSELGKKATYTKVGEFADSARRQLGLSVGSGAVARREYISKIDNEILPLLRQTFGAQFTQKEGESLKATLGDPTMAPEEKDAVLRSFIDSKRAYVGTLKRRTGQSVLDQADAILRGR